MPEGGTEKTMDEILDQVQREYAEQAKRDAPAQPYIAVRDAEQDTSNGSPTGLANWEKFTPHEIEQVRQRVARERAAVLSRQAAELKALDAEQEEIDKLERLITAFSQKHGASGQSGA